MKVLCFLIELVANIVTTVRARKIRWAGYVACVRIMIYALVENLK